MNCIALIIKEARKFKMQGGYSKYDLLQKFRSVYNPHSCHLMKPESHGGAT
jgi:hypothetical protein